MFPDLSYLVVLFLFLLWLFRSSLVGLCLGLVFGLVLLLHLLRLDAVKLDGVAQHIADERAL